MTDHLHILNIRGMTGVLVEAMQDGAFVTAVDMHDLLAHVDGVAAEASAIVGVEARIAGMRIATALAALVAVYIKARSVAA